MLFPKRSPRARLKPQRFEDRAHLETVRRLPCLLMADGDCSGPVQAHHLLRPWVGARGTGKRSDDRNVVPLCGGHHRALHRRGDEDAFWQETRGAEDFGRLSAKAFWLAGRGEP